MPVPALRVALLALLLGASASLAGRPAVPVTVHEWGTFTTVADEQGRSTEWLPLGGPTDLPCFVYHFDNKSLVKGLAAGVELLTYQQARTRMPGTVRMETPVLYFYAPQPTTVGVKVGFAPGMMTEWYPKAEVAQSAAHENALRDGAFSLLSWPQVRVRPGADPALPMEQAPSHYYAARATDAAPIEVGGEHEAFLFYRGVGGFQAPLAVIADDRGITLKSPGPDSIPGAVWFENRGGRIGYRVLGPLTGETQFTPPPLDDDVTMLHAELAQILVASGLYEREAAAMIETWRDSWFEEGARLFYLVPTTFVDHILPLSIEPGPEAVVRTFVGRVEVITPATLAVVGEAIAEADDETMLAYGRFLEPITDRLLVRSAPADRDRIRDRVQATWRAYVSRLSARCP